MCLGGQPTTGTGRSRTANTRYVIASDMLRVARDNFKRWNDFPQTKDPKQVREGTSE